MFDAVVKIERGDPVDYVKGYAALFGRSLVELSGAGSPYVDVDVSLGTWAHRTVGVHFRCRSKDTVGGCLF